MSRNANNSKPAHNLPLLTSDIRCVFCRKMQRRREKAGIWDIAQEELVATRVRSYHGYPPIPTRSGLLPFTVFLLEVLFIFNCPIFTSSLIPCIHIIL